MGKKKINVKREDRLMVDLVLRFPDPNRGKKYSDIDRKYIVSIDGEDHGVYDMACVPTMFLKVRCRSLISIRKIYRMPDAKADSIMEYRVGENIARLYDEGGFVKKFEVNFTDANILDVKDSFDFTNLKEVL